MDDFSIVKSPRYIVRCYTDQIYKIIRINHSVKYSFDEKSQKHSYDEKLDNNLSRARKVILEKALCNPWNYFFTFTLDGEKWSRADVNSWYKPFSQWLRDQRKRGYTIKYLIIPERHQDGNWHCHGFLYGDMHLVPFSSYNRPVPKYLIDKDFLDWPEYSSKFGFCSLGRIRSPVRSSFYITKYITKDNDRLVTDKGSHLFMSSLCLNVSEPILDIHDNVPELDRFLTTTYQFCKVGMTKVSDNVKWYDFMNDSIPFVPLFDDKPFDQLNFCDDLYQINYEQLSMY